MSRGRASRARQQAPRTRAGTGRHKRTSAQRTKSYRASRRSN